MIQNWLALHLCIMTNAGISDAVRYMESGRMTKRIKRIRIVSNEDDLSFGNSIKQNIKYKREDIADEPAKVTIAIPSQKYHHNYSINASGNI